MSFFENRLPERLSFGARGGPAFSTEVVKTQGGQRSSNRNWLFPLHRFDVSHGVKSEEDFDEIRSFFYNVSGQFDGFRFKDWADYKANRQPLTTITLGTSYQLNRQYVRGSRTFNRPIYKPVSGTIVVYRNGSVIAPAVSTTTGVVSITGHTGGDFYTWSGEFDIPVAFTSDILETVIENKTGSGGTSDFLISWPSIQLEEIRL